jgi:pimeloyl-ACP methyl ester carboxylesterase
MSEARLPKADRRATVLPAVAPSSQVHLSWLLGALGLLVLAALCCAYLSLCLLFAQGQWQLLYRPPQQPGHTDAPAELKLPFSDIRFGVNEAGVSELSGWWLPGASPSGATVLYLHDAAASLSSSLPELNRLHTLGCTVFAIDYRGYGASATLHPSEARMVEDAGRALLYLTQTRHIPASSIVLWGRGTGATIAAEASQQQGVTVRLVMQDVNQPAIVLLAADPRTRLLPLRLLLEDQLDAAPALRSSGAPKLFLEPSSSGTAPGDGVETVKSGRSAPGIERTRRLYEQASDPKQITSADDEATLRAFLSGRSE